MAIFNHNLSFRPLRGGVAVLNPIVNKIGTIGLVGTSDGEDRWIVSCYHVFGRIDFSDFNDGEPIYQPGDDRVPPVARNAIDRADSKLDCAAAKVEPGFTAAGEILGLMAITGLGEAAVGMRVIKSGCVTGITEGIVTNVQGDEVEIGLSPGFAATYELSAEGDSGAAWVDRQSGQAVALHKAGSNTGIHKAIGSNIKRVLSTLRLRLAP